MRIPKTFALDAHLENDTIVKISLVDEKIVSKPVIPASWTLEKLLEGVNSKNIHQETDTGNAVGNEIW